MATAADETQVIKQNKETICRIQWKISDRKCLNDSMNVQFIMIVCTYNVHICAIRFWFLYARRSREAEFSHFKSSTLPREIVK